MKVEMEANRLPAGQASVPLGRVTQAYLDTLNDPSMLPKLQQMIASMPHPLQGVIPNPKRVLEEKQDLTDRLLQTRSLLQ
jgi:hypothetical protein